MMENFEAGHVCWDDRDVIGGRPTGVVRASFGYASSLVDAAAIGVCVVELAKGPALWSTAWVNHSWPPS